jgi:fructose-1,6-bisphosphatase/inositol monophosphatase family enzyme
MQKAIHEQIKDLLCEAGKAVSDKVFATLQQQNIEQMAQVYHEGQDDTIYQIDKDIEDLLVPFLADRAAYIGGIALVAEGISTAEEPLVLPENLSQEAAAWRVIIDPIDGTRGIMYDKRAAFFLAAAAPNKGPETQLKDIEVAVMVEIPTSKGRYQDTLWAIRGKEAAGHTTDLIYGTVKDKKFQPSKATTIEGGFAQIAKFFPPGRDVIAALEEELINRIFPNFPSGKALLFDDQYISSGGQLYELIAGHDRFTADIRSGLYEKRRMSGLSIGHVCHPYDICTFLIGEMLGVVLTDLYGNPLQTRLDTHSPVSWIGYANRAIQQEVEPHLLELLEVYRFL